MMQLTTLPPFWPSSLAKLARCRRKNLNLARFETHWWAESTQLVELRLLVKFQSKLRSQHRVGNLAKTHDLRHKKRGWHREGWYLGGTEFFSFSKNNFFYKVWKFVFQIVKDFFQKYRAFFLKVVNIETPRRILFGADSELGQFVLVLCSGFAISSRSFKKNRWNRCQKWCELAEKLMQNEKKTPRFRWKKCARLWFFVPQKKSAEFGTTKVPPFRMPAA